MAVAIHKYFDLVNIGREDVPLLVLMLLSCIDLNGGGVVIKLTARSRGPDLLMEAMQFLHPAVLCALCNKFAGNFPILMPAISLWLLLAKMVP